MTKFSIKYRNPSDFNLFLSFKHFSFEYENLYFSNNRSHSTGALMRAVNPVRAGTCSFQPSHLTLSRYYYFIFYSSSFYLFSLSLLPRLRCVWWLALLDKPLSPTLIPRPSVFSHPLLPTHPSPVSHTLPPFDSASPRRHATFDFHAREDDDAAAAAAERRAKCRSKSLPYYFAWQDRFLCTQR